MRRATRQPLLSGAAALLLAPSLAVSLAVSLAACGGGDVPAGSAPAPSSAAPGTDEPSPGATAAREGQGSLADEPAYEDRSARTLAAGEDVAVPFDPPAGTLGALAEAGVVMPASGATTLTCDLGADGSVALRLSAEGAWSVVQQAGAGATELASGQLDPGQRAEPGELTALRLLCSGSPDGLAVGVSLHGAEVSFVEGATGDVPAAGPTWTLAATGETEVRLEAVLLRLVEA